MDVGVEKLKEEVNKHIFKTSVVQYRQYHKQGAMEPSVLGLRVLQPYVPLRATMQRKRARR